MNTTIRDVISDPSMRRVLSMGPDGISENQRARLSRQLLSRYQTRVSAAANLDYLIKVAQTPEGPESAVARNTLLASLSDEALMQQFQLTAASASTPGEVLNSIEKKIISAVQRGADEIGALCEQSPKHLKEAKGLLEEVRAAKASSSWLRRTAAEAAEELLERAIKFGNDAEDDHALQPEGKRKVEASAQVTAHGTGVKATGKIAQRMIRKAYSCITDMVEKNGLDLVEREYINRHRGNAKSGPCLEFITGHKLIVSASRGGLSHQYEVYNHRGEEVCAGSLDDCCQTVISALKGYFSHPHMNLASPSSLVDDLLRARGREDLL